MMPRPCSSRVHDVIIMDLDDPLEGGPCYQLYTVEVRGAAAPATAASHSSQPQQPATAASHSSQPQQPATVA